MPAAQDAYIAAFLMVAWGEVLGVVTVVIVDVAVDDGAVAFGIRFADNRRA